jgi:transposase
MLMGEKSKLPILQVVYSGSIRDVSTLMHTLQTASNLNLKDMSLVMDKGFAKTDNINKLLSKEAGSQFLIALPFTMAFAKNQVIREAEGIDCAGNTIVIGSDVLRGITSSQIWSESKEVFVHAYFNPVVASHARNALFCKVTELSNRVKQNPGKHLNDADAKKYLTVKKNKGTDDVSVKIKEKTIASELMTKGWVVIIGNHIDNAQDALKIYRAKDVVEKGFLRMKSCLDLARLRVHSDETMQSKIFVGFIALIITAHIHKVMLEKQLYKSWTMKKMFKILERLKIHYIKNDQIISPLTKDHKRIFAAFGM